MASSFRALNSSTGISLHPLVLLTAVLPKGHLTCSSECQDLCGWPYHHSNLVHLDLLHSSSMYSFHLFLMSSVSTRSLAFLSFIVLFFGQNIPLISPIFLKRSLVFLFYCFLLVLYTVQRRASCLSVLFFGNLQLAGYTFPFLPCFLLLLLL